MNGIKKAPALFIGHGSPMNAIEQNRFSISWQTMAKKIIKPQAILVISAHWFTEGTKIMTHVRPKTIHDMYGFPPELYRITYPAAGSPELAKEVMDLLPGMVQVDNEWGYDHGAWSVLRHMYPAADLPVVQFSIDWNLSPVEHFRIGQILSLLRNKGVMILGSGNIVHNLAKIDWDMEGGFPWADTFDEYIIQAIRQRRFEDVIQYEKAGASAKFAFYTPEHFIPLLYVLGAVDSNDSPEFFNAERLMGSMSMTSVLFQ